MCPGAYSLQGLLSRRKFTSLLVPQAPLLQTFLPATERLIAIGDLHGDIDKARRAFRLAGLIDENDRWSGGTTTAVQVVSSFSMSECCQVCNFAPLQRGCTAGASISESLLLKKSSLSGNSRIL